MDKSIVRSPFFYVGDKYKLMSQLRKLFPQDISIYIEPFVGGGSSFLNTTAKKYIVNDVDPYVIKLHKYISSFAGKKDAFLQNIYNTIEKYGLSCSYKNTVVPDELKKEYVKTYYSHYNKLAYQKMKNDFNSSKDPLLLYLLLIYGFNHMIRFNSSGLFNLPVGNVDYNKNVYNALCNYLDFMDKHDVQFFNKDYRSFLNDISFDKKTFLYFDPPYLISGSEYNKYWNSEEEKKLCEHLDFLDTQGVHFGITNLISHKGKTNTTFLEWSKKYICYEISSNYISFNDNTIKANSKEVYITNHG
ncbi:MAG: Dam family site-specific DNA-(adenine-N6)-methyltransferase [Alphaproteobacteria bacterium]|nr:Dam family site-specific DNA-(adenine-N6)-methyltransferase [Alphaproteobacteria bacterium]